MVLKREMDVPDWFEPGLSDPLERSTRFVMPLQTQLIYTMGGRRFFVTRRGWFGIGPCGMQRGDAVCVLFGADMAIVLRRRNGDGGDSGDSWMLMGEAYVHRLADRAGIQMHKDQPDVFPAVGFLIR
jgi:hypothetical protein